MIKATSISGETTISLGLSCILQIVLTWSPCEHWQRCRWTKLFGWNATNFPKMHGLASAKK